jgi:hypothetical protein
MYGASWCPWTKKQSLSISSFGAFSWQDPATPGEKTSCAGASDGPREAIFMELKGNDGVDDGY